MKIFFILLFIINISNAQTLSSNLDKKNIGIGESVTLKINISDLKGKEVITAQKNGLLPFHFEEIKDEIDHQPHHYTRTIEFNIFNEGKFTIPELEFKIGDSIYKTISYQIEVTNTTAIDEEINDIMPNEEIKLGSMDYWILYKNYIFIVLFVVLALMLAFLFKKYYKKNPKEITKTPNKILSNLEKLYSKKYIEKQEYRLFYIELLDICRDFLETKYQISAKILLTDDLLDLIKKDLSIPTENKEKLKDVFTRGDLVKFAKTIPNETIMNEDFYHIKNWIKSELNKP